MGWEEYVSTRQQQSPVSVMDVPFQQPQAAVQMPPADPASAILSAIGEVKQLVLSVRAHDDDLEKFWERLERMDQEKATRVELRAAEERFKELLETRLGRAVDTITEIETRTEGSDESFDQLALRMTQIEIDTAKIPSMQTSIASLISAVNKMNGLRQQIKGAIWAFLLTGGVVIVFNVPWQFISHWTQAFHWHF